MDQELMAAINAQADRAADARPQMFVRDDLATALHQNFPDSIIEEIADKLDDVWRSRGLFFATVHR
ncbi:hypothetical protein [Rhizobium leguminosarum]|uniref:hypothetical protein n=1 Tax=Rhizobium leguminosarum TaxID=384 RepID=UPI00103C6F93|nr:hypothetical protein [Rhizobium leguminosarum]TBZ07595.1 hypothetical protein E0H33_30445 [Rhizobium leguminosarum bv. viciae]